MTTLCEARKLIIFVQRKGKPTFKLGGDKETSMRIDTQNMHSGMLVLQKCAHACERVMSCFFIT